MNSFYKSIPILPTSELAPLYKMQLSNTLLMLFKYLQFHVFYELIDLDVHSIIQFELFYNENNYFDGAEVHWIGNYIIVI